MQKRKNKYTIVSRLNREPHEKPWSLHVAGCIDVSRDKFEHQGRLHIVPGEITDPYVAQEWWISTAPDGQGWYPDQIEMHHCVIKEEVRAS